MRAAIYELEIDASGYRYRFLRTQLISPDCDLSGAIKLTDATS